MNQIKANTQNTRSLAARFTALAVKAAPWRRSVGLATLALGLGGIVSTAQATLLVYEPFDYPTVGVTINGLNGGTGFGAAWAAWNTGSGIYATPNGFAVCDATSQTWWNGTLLSVPGTGKFAGSPAPAANASSGFNGNNPDHLIAERPLDPSVTAMFTPGAVTWMSFVEASNFKANGNGLGVSFAIGAGAFSSTPGGGSENRAQVAYGGPAVGIGLNLSHFFTAGIWPNVSPYGITGPNGVSFPATSTALRVCIAKIIWGDATTTPTQVYQTTFLDGVTITEAAFDTAAVNNSAIIDPATFNKVLIGGTRANIDELRITTTFSEVIGITPATDGPYWAPGVGGGGSGTWSSTATVWSAAPSAQGTLLQRNGVPLLFAGTAGTVTIDGTVAADSGLTFSVTGYSVVPGASIPSLDLTGASAAANTITVPSGTATISAQVTGANGLTKAGTGTLILSGTGNTYGGGTLLNVGTLQIADVGSLGSANVTFGGGILQYPPGSGASAIDVSGKVPTVASPKVANIDTDGYDVTFNNAIGGNGGLTKLGTGSLTLGAAVPTGQTTVSAGTLNVSSASGTIATLNVPAGGTVNLGAGSVVTALNITGGKVNITGAGVQVTTLFTSGGTLDASAFPLTVLSSASIVGNTFTLSGAPSFTLSGANVADPSALNIATLTSTGGTLTHVATGVTAAFGHAAPGIAALPATATFSGSGAWTVAGGAVQTIDNGSYGTDNHSFHHIRLPTGDFDIKAHVTIAANGYFGLMARDNLTSLWNNNLGQNWAGIWTRLSNPVRSGVGINGVMTLLNTNTGAAWLEVKKVGNIVTTYFSNDGITYNPVQVTDYTASPWGPTTYLGLDLIDAGTPGAASGAFDNVNFMGTAGSADMSTTDFVLSGGAQMDLGPVLYVKSVSTNGVALAEGCWAGSALPGATHIDPVTFTSTGTGIAVIPPTVAPPPPPTISSCPADITTNVSEPAVSKVVTFATPTATDGLLPVSINCSPASGSTFPSGTTKVTCTATDSVCPFGRSGNCSFNVTVVVLPPQSTASIIAPDIVTGDVTITFDTVVGLCYKVEYTDSLPATSWGQVAGSVNGDASPKSLVDAGATGASPQRFYRVVQVLGPCPP